MYILYDSSTAPSGRVLAKELNNHISCEHGDSPSREYAYDILLRYGSSQRIRYEPGRIINKREAVKMASNKKLMVEKLLNKWPNLCPFMLEPDSYPIYGFKKYHSRGKGIVLLMSKEDKEYIEENEGNFAYFSRPLEIRHEYRVHLCRNETKLMIKRRPHIITSDIFIIRNLSKGYNFTTINNPSKFLRTEIIQNATNIKNLFELDFCGIDMVLDSYKKPWVLEVNSAPSLSTNERTLEFYVNNIKRMINI